MIHTILIACHATAATVALLAGLAAFRLPRLVGLHTATTLLMTASLAGALWVGRDRNPVPLGLIFLGLLALAGYMSWRSVQAWRHRPARGGRPTIPYLAAIGFNCIGLTTGLAAIGVLRLGWGVPAIVAASILPTLVGRIPLARVLRAADRPEPAPTA